MKPSWIWGAEMGANEFGLNIGNEAVFTREKKGPEALLGMDMLRLALERCRNSEETLGFLVKLLDRYGQGGNCGYRKKFYYHNSFLIADPFDAWVLETAGKYWAAEKVYNVRSISNRLSIGSNYDLAHPDLVKHAVEKKWCKSEDDFNFAHCYSEPVFSHFSGSGSRGSSSSCILESEKGSINLQTMKKILRSHEKGVEGRQFTRHSLKSVCMHGGFIFGDHTTGSYIAEIGENKSTYLVTGCSTPCLALFKPLWMPGESGFAYNENDTEKALEFWLKRELFHRAVLENRVPDFNDYLKERDCIENNLDQRLSKVDIENTEPYELGKISSAALKEEENLLDKYYDKINGAGLPAHIKGNAYFRSYWRCQTQDLVRQ